MWQSLEVHEPPMPALLRPRARVLLVEEDEVLRSQIASRLLRDGFDVYQADSAADAVEVLAALADDGEVADAVDLLVLDVSRGDRSSIAFVRALREAGCDLPVLFLSAFPDPDVSTSASELAAFVLSMPFSLEGLSDTALEVIEGVRLHDRLS